MAPHDDFSAVHRAVVDGTTRDAFRRLLWRLGGGSDWRLAQAANYQPKGESPLQAAVRLNRGDLAAELLVAGARAEYLFPERRANALAICLHYDEPGALRELLRDGHFARQRVRYEIGGTIGGSENRLAFCCPVHLAIVPPRWGVSVVGPRPLRLDCLRILVQEGGASVNDLDHADNTPLHWLVRAGFFRRGPPLAELLSLGARLEARNAAGLTPLFLATQHLDVEMVELLLSHGALADVRDDLGVTPLMSACRDAQAFPALIKTVLSASSSETRRAVSRDNGFSAID
jgi:ankyrin repeat protein